MFLNLTRCEQKAQVFVVYEKQSIFFNLLMSKMSECL